MDEASKFVNGTGLGHASPTLIPHIQTTVQRSFADGLDGLVAPSLGTAKWKYGICDLCAPLPARRTRPGSDGSREAPSRQPS